MARWFGVVAAALVLAGCATSMTRRYAGQPVQAAIAGLGDPHLIYDLSGGRRVFEWSTSDVVLTSAPDGGYSPSLWTESAPVPEGLWLARDCQITVFGRWSAERRTWVVEKMRGSVDPPPPAHCALVARR